MSETKPIETKPKKMVSRNVTIALGIICIILVVGLIGAVAFYTFQISLLNSKVNDLTNITNLADSIVWVNNLTVSPIEDLQLGHHCTFIFPANYSGYVSVNVLSSTNTTYVELTYTSYGVNYDSQVNVGTNGTAYFPVLPASPTSCILVVVGDKNLINGATETITITYYY